MDIQCVIAAGGRGTRLRPITDSIPKPMILVHGIPFLHLLINNLVSFDISRFVILTGYLSQNIVSYFGDGNRFGCSIRYSNEDRPLGTGGALLAAKDILEDEFIYANGDDLPEVDYTALVTSFHQQSSLGMVVVCKDAAGHLMIDKQTGKVEEYFVFTYLPYLDCGTKVFKKDVLDVLYWKVPFDLEPALWPILIGRQQLSTFQISSKPYGLTT